MKTRTLIAVLAAIVAVCAAFAVFCDSGDKSVAVIMKNGKAVKTVEIDSLSEGFEYAVDEHNTVFISKDGVSMCYADCPDKACMRMGVRRSGSVICLPNRVEIKFVAGREDDADAYTE